MGLVEQIKRAARERTLTTGEKVITISVADVKAVAEYAGVTVREVELLALDNGVVPARYDRNLGTVGMKGQSRLLRSVAAVLGAGGLGGTVIELLARLGVGRLTVIDAELFEDNNLNRQVLATEETLGWAKAHVAARRVRTINSAVEVSAHVVRADEARLIKLLEGHDIAIDALDTVGSRQMLQRVASRLEIPLVHGAIAGFMGQVTTIFPGDPGVACFYSLKAPDRGKELQTGNPPFTPALVAAWQVAEAVKILLGVGQPLRGRLLVVDTLAGSSRVIDL